MARGRLAALAILVAIGMTGTAGVASADGYNSSTNLGERRGIGRLMGEHYQHAQDSKAHQLRGATPAFPTSVNTANAQVTDSIDTVGIILCC